MTGWENYFKSAGLMDQKDLENFIKNPPKEGSTLEYKLKPNFNEIEQSIKHITKRMHFNILKTVYAFANTEGGDLFIGICEHTQNQQKKYEITGIDTTDEGIVTSILKRVNQKIDKKIERIQLKEQKRTVLHIKIQPLKWVDKPQLLNGILYIREDANTIQAQSASEATSVYTTKQLFYLFLTKNLKDILFKSIDNKNNSFSFKFIEALTNHITAKYSNVEQEKLVTQCLNNIKKVMESDKSPFKTTKLPDLEDKNKLIDEFIDAYKSILQTGV